MNYNLPIGVSAMFNAVVCRVILVLVLVVLIGIGSVKAAKLVHSVHKSAQVTIRSSISIDIGGGGEKDD